MRFENDGIELWYGTKDAPAPEGTVRPDDEILIIIGIRPVDDKNAVEVLYQVNSDKVTSLEAKWFKNDSTGKIQYFRAEFPKLREGDTVDYSVVCRCQKRQVPSPKDLEKMATTFQVLSLLPVPPPPVLPGIPRGAQTRDLVMLALPVTNDRPPNKIQPKLIDGIHLRWAFKQDLGFPWSGFYLFRRGHIKGDPVCLSRATGNLTDGPYAGTEIVTPFGSISSDQLLLLTDDFPRPPGQTTGGFVEFDLKNRSYLLFKMPNNSLARHIDVRIGFKDRVTVTVTALLWGVPVGENQVSGTPGQTVTTVLEYDAITEVRISGGSAAALVDVCYVRVADDERRDWTAVPGFDYPMRLPVTHPNYPCTLTRPENLATARDLARRRISYGDPTRFVSSQPLQTAGTVNVTNGSPIITGFGTSWDDRLAGHLLLVEPDATAFAVIEVISPTKLVLSRPYVGTTRARARYAIHADSFGQLHDCLANLVMAGAAQPMASLTIPRTVYSTGTISVHRASDVVDGAGTNWGREYEGLTLQVFANSAGTVFDLNVTRDPDTITGVGTNWTSDLVGLGFRVEGEESIYTITSVDSPTRMVIDRPYSGVAEPGMRYSIFEKATYTVASVESPTRIILDRSYAGFDGPAKSYSLAAKLTSGHSPTATPVMPRQHPLDMVLMSAINPAMAQAVGLYWVDTDAIKTPILYDYLIVADYGGLGGLTSQGVLNEIAANGFNNLLAWIVFKKTIAPAPPMMPPEGLEVYALPGTTVRAPSGELTDAINSAGLRWNLGLTNGELAPGRPVMYHLWRANLGDSPNNQAEHNPLTEGGPLLVNESQPLLGETPQRPPDWPPFPLYAIDRGLADGWYSYQVNGIDIFGRHSVNSAAAAWRFWEPPPEQIPWYVEDPPLLPAPAPFVVHPNAIWMRNDMPPPPPTGVEAYALDPQDPLVLRDEAYNSWWNALTASPWYQALSQTERNNLIGLRVSWLWTQSHISQAPNTREFRIYYQPDRLNAVLGRTTIVTASGPTESRVDTDIANTLPANAYVGAWLRIGASAFRIVASESGTPLRVRVRSGPIYSSGTLTAQQQSDTVTGRNTAWDTSLAGLALTIAGEQMQYTILSVDPATQELKLDRLYRGTSGNNKSYTIAGRLPQANAPCTVALPPPFFSGTIAVLNGSQTVTGENTSWHNDLVGLRFKVAGDDANYIIASANGPGELVINQPYNGPSVSNKRYQISHPQFVDYTEPTNWEERFHVVHYQDHVTEVVPPMPDRNGNPLRGNEALIGGNQVELDGNPDLSSLRVSQNHIFVPHLYLADDTGRTTRIYRIIAADDLSKIITLDGAPVVQAGRSAWAIGYPARRYEAFLPVPASSLHSGLPLTPTLVEPVVYAHIGVSAADDKEYVEDDEKWLEGNWGGANRYGNEGAVSLPAKVFRVRREPPPVPEVPLFDSDKVFATPADYHSRSFYTYRWKPETDPNTGQAVPLKCHIFRALDDAVFRADWLWRRNQNTPFELSATDAEHLRNFFPQELRGIDEEPRRLAVADSINQLNAVSQSAAFSDARPAYKSLSNDALRVLAGLPGSEAAFTQLTLHPLDPFDEANADVRGPDDRGDYEEDSNLRAYIDTLDGRTMNCYFYRCGFIDGAQNRSQRLSLATPPVGFHDVVPPRAPVLTKALGDERQILLRWASNREADLAEYRIYRSDNFESARDIRLMTLAHSESVPDGDPQIRPAELSWSDGSIASGRSYWYRLVAVDRSNNVSAPSPPVQARAYRLGPPPPPEWTSAAWFVLHRAIRLEWSSQEPGLQALLQRRSSPSARWVSITNWLRSDTTSFEDASADPQRDNYYRIKMRDDSGNVSVDYVPTLVPRSII